MPELYKLTSPCGKQYVGITKRTAKWRWSIHKRNARYTNSASAINSAIRKHGPDGWAITVLETGEWEDIVSQEPQAILDHDTLTPSGYNIVLPNGDGFGPEFNKRVQTPEFRAICSERAKAQWRNPSFREKMATRTVNRDASARGGKKNVRKMLAHNIELWKDTDWRAKASAARKDIWQRPGYREEMSRKIRKGMARAAKRKEILS